MLLTKMHFTLQWILFSTVIPICRQDIHHLPGIRVNSIMRNTASYEVVSGDCLFLHVYSVHSGFKYRRCCAWCCWSCTAAQASQARASKAARGPCPLFCASGRDREPAQVKDRSVDGSLCGLQNLQTLNFQILNIHSFKHSFLSITCFCSVEAD